MAQDFRTILGSDLISTSRTYLNDNFEAVRSAFAGGTEPTSPVAYMTWYDTASGYEKQRNAANDAWIVVGVLGQSYRGLLARSGGTMSGAIDMGGYTITNLGLGTGLAAARQQELDLKAPLASPSFTGDPTVNQDPATTNSLVRRSWAEGRYLKLAGGTMTGALLLSAYGGAATEAVPRQSVEDMVTFNTSTGHRHDGTNSRRVLGEDLSDINAGGSGKTLKSTGSGYCSWVMPTVSRIVYGSITSVGGISDAGSGDWTPSQLGVGNYRITVSPAMPQIPPFVFREAGVMLWVFVQAKSASVVDVIVHDQTSTPTNAGVAFVFFA